MIKEPFIIIDKPKSLKEICKEAAKLEKKTRKLLITGMK